MENQSSINCEGSLSSSTLRSEKIFYAIALHLRNERATMTDAASSAVTATNGRLPQEGEADRTASSIDLGESLPTSMIRESQIEDEEDAEDVDAVSATGSHRKAISCSYRSNFFHQV